MPPLTCLPPVCRSALEGLRSEFKWDHFLTFSWLLVLQLLNFGPGNLRVLSRMTRAISYDQMTRFLIRQLDCLAIRTASEELFDLGEEALAFITSSTLAVNYSNLFAAYVLSSIPMLVLFLYATKPFMAGLTSGAFKA